MSLKRGILAFSAVQAGNHHDLYDIVTQFEQILSQLTVIGIRLEGLALVIRYDKTARNWLNFNILAFIIKTIKKFK